MPETTDTENESGRIWILDGKIHYSSGVYGTWDLPIAQIRVVGEYTNQDGPLADDYFIVFLRSADEMWFEASVYAEGWDDCMSELRATFGDNCQRSLNTSTDFESCIWWPPELSNEKLFRFNNSFWRLRFRNDQHLSDAVIAFLQQDHSQQSVRQ